ncbi:MAG: N-acetylneuraminate synthase [Pelagibacterales bacterium]|nr:N-acetylneuraminate synthase [Pelagibacterales bacterium]
MKNNKTIIIAEAGVNHNGKINLAKKLIKEAALAGVNYVKFQTYTTKYVVTEYAKKTNYQKKNTKNNETQFNMLKKYQLSYSDHISLINCCKKNKIKFLSSPFDKGSIDLLIDLKLDTLKIPSGEITNLPYLKHIGKFSKSLILSTGMSTLDEVKNAVKILNKAGTPLNKITVLHCTTSYPTNMEDVNLNAMLTLKKKTGLKVGYSDHTLGVEVSIAAVTLGAEIIEKHLTISRKMKGPDHKASLEPQDLKLMVDKIRNIEKALGNGKKIPKKNELKNMLSVRKSIVAAQKINKGDKFTNHNLAIKRPGTGISPMYIQKLIGKVSKRNFIKDELISN